MKVLEICDQKSIVQSKDQLVAPHVASAHAENNKLFMLSRRPEERNSQVIFTFHDSA